MPFIPPAELGGILAYFYKCRNSILEDIAKSVMAVREPPLLDSRFCGPCTVLVQGGNDEPARMVQSVGFL
jgi:hypothetical protein